MEHILLRMDQCADDRSTYRRLVGFPLHLNLGKQSNGG